LDAEVLIGDECMDIEVRDAFAADLLSDVLAFAKEGTLLITGITNPQVIRTAEMLELIGIVFVRGKKPDEEMGQDLDTCLVLHADHTFNASTFACREVVSTRAHMYAGVSAGIGALSGSLHGGANARVMKMLMELESQNDIAGWVQNKLDGGDKIMGMGHAVYKTMDPRARYLKDMAARLGEKTGQEKWHELSTQIERHGLEAFRKKGKTDILPNVDFYSAPVYHIMGIPLDLMTPIFAISRVSGWCAHIIEEKYAEAQERPALYRPHAEYVGQYCGLSGCTYESPEERENQD